MDKLQLNSIHHVAIICSNYAVSKHFYTEILGMEMVQESFREARQSYKLDLKVGNRYQLELFSFIDPPPRPSYPEACGLRHLAFEVSDIAQAVAVLNSRGVATEPVRTDALTQKQFSFFADPDGLPLEIYQQ